MIEFVVREGPMFEAMIMNREINNPMYRSARLSLYYFISRVLLYRYDAFAHTFLSPVQVSV